MEAQVPDEREFSSVAGMETGFGAVANAWRRGPQRDRQRQWEGRGQGQIMAPLPLEVLNGYWRAEGMGG